MLHYNLRSDLEILIKIELTTKLLCHQVFLIYFDINSKQDVIKAVHILYQKL